MMKGKQLKLNWKIKEMNIVSGNKSKLLIISPKKRKNILHLLQRILLILVKLFKLEKYEE